MSVVIARILGKGYFVDYSIKYSKLMVINTLLMLGLNSLVIARKTEASKVQVLNMIITWILILTPILIILYLLLDNMLCISISIFIVIKFLPIYYISNKRYIAGILMDSIAINIAILVFVLASKSVDIGIFVGGLTVLLFHGFFLTKTKIELVNPFKHFKESLKYWFTNSSRLVIDLFLLSIVDVYFSTDELSEIALAMKLSLVFSLLLNSLNTWIEGTINDHAREDNIKRYFEILKLTIPLSISICLIMFILQPYFFEIWDIGVVDGNVYRMLIVANVALLATGPTNQILAYNGMLNIYLIIVSLVLLCLFLPYLLNVFTTFSGREIIAYYVVVIVVENLIKVICLFYKKKRYLSLH
jgi:hypothetical protein